MKPERPRAARPRSIRRRRGTGRPRRAAALAGTCAGGPTRNTRGGLGATLSPRPFGVRRIGRRRASGYTRRRLPRRSTGPLAKAPKPRWHGARLSDDGRSEEEAGATLPSTNFSSSKCPMRAVSAACRGRCSRSPIIRLGRRACKPLPIKCRNPIHVCVAPDRTANLTHYFQFGSSNFFSSTNECIRQCFDIGVRQSNNTIFEYPGYRLKFGGEERYPPRPRPALGMGSPCLFRLLAKAEPYSAVSSRTPC